MTRTVLGAGDNRVVPLVVDEVYVAAWAASAVRLTTSQNFSSATGTTSSQQAYKHSGRLVAKVASEVLSQILRFCYFCDMLKSCPQPAPQAQAHNSDTPVSAPATSPWTNNSMLSRQRV